MAPRTSLHPRAYLANIVATQCNDFEVRGFYRSLGREGFFASKPSGNDPIRNLAEFLCCFTVSGGSRNAFLAPIAAVCGFLDAYAIKHDPRSTMLALKAAYDDGDVTAESLDAAIRGCLPRTM